MNKEIKIFNSFAEQEEADIEHYVKMEPHKKIEELEFIRESFLNMINATPEERRLQKVIKVYSGHEQQEEDDRKIFEEFRKRIRN